MNMIKLIMTTAFLYISCTTQEQVFTTQEQVLQSKPEPLLDSLMSKPSTLNESWDIWRNWKKQKGNIYSYSIRYSSVFGYWNEKKLSIRNDSVKNIYVIEGSNESSITRKFQLNFDTIGKSKKGFYKTIDELYQFCQDSVLTLDRLRNDIPEPQYLSNGILKRCTYYSHGCEDDCVRGPQIDSVFF